MTEITKGFYRARYEALGYNVSSWARRCGVNRSTIIRHNQMEERGERHLIPGPFWVIIEILETAQNDQ